MDECGIDTSECRIRLTAAPGVLWMLAVRGAGSRTPALRHERVYFARTIFFVWTTSPALS